MRSKCLLLLFVLAAVVPARADVVMDLNQTFSGDTPVGTLQAIFSNVTGGVLLTLNAVNFGGGEKVSEWDFNINPSLDTSLGSLTFAYQSGVMASVPPTAGIDFEKADGAGWFDIKFLFRETGTTFSAANSQSVYLISGISPLWASDFQFQTENPGGKAPYYSAAHVQAASGGYGWIGAGSANGDDYTVPEPGTWMLIGAGATLLGLGKLYRPYPRP